MAGAFTGREEKKVVSEETDQEFINSIGQAAKLTKTMISLKDDIGDILKTAKDAINSAPIENSDKKKFLKSFTKGILNKVKSELK